MLFEFPRDHVKRKVTVMAPTFHKVHFSLTEILKNILNEVNISMVWQKCVWNGSKVLKNNMFLEGTTLKCVDWRENASHWILWKALIHIFFRNKLNYYWGLFPLLPFLLPLPLYLPPPPSKISNLSWSLTCYVAKGDFELLTVLLPTAGPTQFIPC